MDRVNRLAGAATSPYLLQHKDNPVDWWPWGAEALAEARRRDVPVLLSVGYAACHWCHVMAHESFEDDATAAYLNERFVASRSTARSGRTWTRSTWRDQGDDRAGRLADDLRAHTTAKPFFAGTYFPAEPRHGMPSFRQVLAAITDAWATRREQGDAGWRRRRGAGAAGDRGAQPGAGRRRARPGGGHAGGPARPGARWVRLRPQVPSVDGAGVPAPARSAHRLGAVDRLASSTFDQMARGGMYDQLGGGFARYSVDAAWVVPHFEKMLYDNALLLRAYLRVAPDRNRWVSGSSRDHRVPAARPAHRRGWLRLGARRGHRGSRGAVLRMDTGGAAAGAGCGRRRVGGELLGVTAAGTFEHGSSVLQLRVDPDDAQRWGRCARGSRPHGRRGTSPAATTRWSPPGTAWR